MRIKWTTVAKRLWFLPRYSKLIWQWVIFDCQRSKQIKSKNNLPINYSSITIYPYLQHIFPFVCYIYSASYLSNIYIQHHHFYYYSNPHHYQRYFNVMECKIKQQVDITPDPGISLVGETQCTCHILPPSSATPPP